MDSESQKPFESIEGKTAVIFDINLVLDYQTLLFCIIRKYLAAGKVGVAVDNGDYALIVNQSFENCMSNFKTKYPDIWQQNQNIQD